MQHPKLARRRLLMAAVSPADLHDSHGGVALLQASRQLWPFLGHCFADRAYRGERVGTATAITVKIVEPKDGQTGFAVQPRRWVIERTLGWIGRCRRLAAGIHRRWPWPVAARFRWFTRHAPGPGQARWAPGHAQLLAVVIAGR